MVGWILFTFRPTRLRKLNNEVMKVCYDNFWRSDECVRLGYSVSLILLLMHFCDIRPKDIVLIDFIILL